MKKFFLMVLTMVLVLNISAQVKPGFRMGVRATTGMSNVIADGNKFEIGYGLGWVAECNFSPHFYLQSGLGVENVAHREDAADKTFHSFFLRLPVHIGSRLNLHDKSSLFVQAGATLGCGMFGSRIPSDSERKPYFDVARRFDLGIGGRIGFEYSSFQVSAGTDYGLLDVFEHGGGRNFTANLGVAYLF